MTVNGRTWVELLSSAACNLENEKEQINNLNVFPVPDGDTGINMSMTIAPVRQMKPEENAPIGEVCKDAASRMLHSARGNSGSIFSLFFRGMGKALEGKSEADTVAFATAFMAGTTAAYKAVNNPTEGTILTVMRLMSEEAVAVAADYKENMLGFFRYLREVAERALQRTPELLPVLRQAHVVDAGGAGFLSAFAGIVSALEGHPVEAEESSSLPVTGQADFSEFNTDDIKFSYCTECIIEKSEEYLGDGKAEAFRETISPMGDSMVFIEDECIIKVHIHVNDPGFILTEAIKYGALSKIKVENMKFQHTALTDLTRPTKDFGFISVCVGDGIAEAFRELGCDKIVAGGQSMNPSTDDILGAIKQCNTKNVFVLPNNKNIFLVAKEAASLTKNKNVVVMETRSVPEGLTCMLNFSPEASLEDNVEIMEESMKGVTSFSVTHAARDSKIDGFDIKKGQYLGLLGGKILCSTDTLEECMEKIADNIHDAEFLTVFAGEDAKSDDVECVRNILSTRSPDSELAISLGGQPLYDFILSAE